jgi:dipeptidyl aminopeptidase/acylaminoacyl peptidase
MSFFRFLLAAAWLTAAAPFLHAQDKKALTVTDMMKFRQLVSPSISRDGRWVVHTAEPDRGDPEVRVYATDRTVQYRIDLGADPVISRDGNWVAATLEVPEEQLLKSKKGKDSENGPKPGMGLLHTTSGEQQEFERIRSFLFSNDSRWILYHQQPVDAKQKTGAPLVVKSLTDTTSRTFEFVSTYALDSMSRYLAFTVSDTATSNNGLYIADLSSPGSGAFPLYRDSSAWADRLTWNNRRGTLAFLAGRTGEKDRRDSAAVFLWEPGRDSAEELITDERLEEGWRVYPAGQLSWTRDGSRLFLGLKPSLEIFPDEEEDSITDIFDTGQILAGRGVDVWHWNDPYINSHQKSLWYREKDRTYAAAYDPGTDRLVRLAGPEMPDLRLEGNSTTLLGSSQVPYAKRLTWDGRYRDYYLVERETGTRRIVVRESEHEVRLSPDGRFLVYYRDGDWYLVDAESLEARNLTGEVGVPFADEDWDYPEDVPGYGVAGWLEESEAVLIYDKFDIWQFPTAGGTAVCLTEGRGREGLYRFRIRDLDPERVYLERGEQVFLTATHDSLKHTALFTMRAGKTGVKAVVEEARKYTLVAKAADADRILFTRESYREFPDLWVTDSRFRKPGRLSDVNPQVSDFAWGNAELVEWRSEGGKPLQGILITPDGYRPGERLPVLVYYYRFFSDRLYDFNEVAVNHRPCFPFYASNGYAVFLPDIRFDVGSPGSSATRCLVPGVQKIIDMGVADPDAICLHGHSWSGYQTAFVITQTDLFTCAIAGAPVSNMTSAYSGIRWESGMARQFQYEQSQSRIGGNLWEARDRYIENSPVFFADRIHTPLLIEFGDADGAVPWYQGIELYLAMRRLGKDCIMLQYRNEPHHLKQYANKLDYTLKFKEYLDHYLKGEPAAGWITEGVPYRGK